MTAGTPGSAPGDGLPRLSLVLSTIGRPDDVRRLLASLRDSDEREALQLVLVDQGDDRASTAVLESEDWGVEVVALTSGRGASVGRNRGLQAATAPLVAFPDDDVYYPPGTLADVRRRMAAEPDLAVLCGRQLTADGRPGHLRWQEHPGVVDGRTFQRTSIMSTMFFRRPWLDRVGPFDEGMGVGSAGWYGSGEESDLLLRVVEAGGRSWYDPAVVVLGDEPRDEPTEAFVEKMLRYGCGQGRLWRQRSLDPKVLAYYVARKGVAATVRAARGQRVLARADVAWARGAVAGWRGVPPRALREQALRGAGR